MNFSRDKDFEKGDAILEFKSSRKSTSHAFR